MMDKRAHHPDDSGFKPGGNDPNPQGNGPRKGMLSAFFPGQKAALAEQLNQGFGGGEEQWRTMMSKTYSPIRNAANFRYGAMGGGNGGGGQSHQPRTTPATSVGFNPGSPLGQAPLSPEMLAMIRNNLAKQGM